MLWAQLAHQAPLTVVGVLGSAVEALVFAPVVEVGLACVADLSVAHALVAESLVALAFVAYSFTALAFVADSLVAHVDWLAALLTLVTAQPVLMTSPFLLGTGVNNRSSF